MINFSWFKPKYSVCKECGVHFDIVPIGEAQWGNLCPTHRKPVMERARRISSVIKWTRCHIDRIGELMDEDIAAQEAAYREMRNRQFQAQMDSQNSCAQGNQYNTSINQQKYGLGGMP